MKKLLVIFLCLISIYSYAEFTDVDRANLALAAREVEEIENNSYPFFALDWVNLFGIIDSIKNNLVDMTGLIGTIDYSIQNYYPSFSSDLTTLSVNTDLILQDVISMSGNLSYYLPNIDTQLSSIYGEANNISLNSYNILNELYSIRENQAQRLDVNLSSLIPKDYKKEIDSAVSGITQLHDDLTQIQVEGLNVTLNGDPHVTAHIENLPDINLDTKQLEDKIVDFNDDFDEYVDSFKNQSITIAGSPLWNDLNIENTDDFSLSPEQSRQGTFFQNLQEMISFLHIQNASLNKSAYLIYQEISGKSTEEEQKEYKDSLEKSLDDISKRGEDAKLEIEASQISLNFDSNKDKLKIDSIFQQFPRGEKPTTLYLTIPSFGEFGSQSLQVDITTLSDFLDTARTLVRLTYIIVLALLIWLLYRFVFPLFLFFVNFIKKVLTIQ